MTAGFLCATPIGVKFAPVKGCIITTQSSLLEGAKGSSRVTQRILPKQRYPECLTEVQATSQRLLAPAVAGKLLEGPQLSFIDFLSDKECAKYLTRLLGGDSTAAGTMVREFREAQRSHYFGHKTSHGRRPAPGLLNYDKSLCRDALKDFARRAYRGDPDRRGIAFWRRVAWLLWNIYQALMAHRAQCEKIKQQETRRLSTLPHKRALGNERARRHRERKKVKKMAQANKSEAEPKKE